MAQFLESVKKTFTFGDHEVTLETGALARQATAAVKVSMGGTTVLVTVVAVKDNGNPRDFFPLAVHYQLRTYSYGKIPGGFFKREGRPTEAEVLTSRLIDRPIRPLFPEGFKQEVQIIAMVMSCNPEIDPDIPALIGASAALSVSGLPFAGPVGAARVGFSDGKYILNPTQTQLADSELDLVVAGTDSSVLMVESEAEELTEQEMLGAVMFGHQQMQVAISAIKEMAAEVNAPAWEWTPPEANTEVSDQVSSLVGDALKTAYRVADKQERYSTVGALREKCLTELVSEDEESPFTARAVEGAFSDLGKNIVREQVLNNEPRIDGRDRTTVRPIQVEVGALERTHGSAVFTRGETQAIVVATLGSNRDAQNIETFAGDMKETFMLHYNFPPYCVGEAGMVGSPKRREIGHGRLAKRAIQAVLPPMDEFPYVLRVVSEITESNGSSSMASVCGTSLALMDAGVPLAAPVAGIAMGLVKDGDRVAVLTDILGDEDHLGDMDFKVAGTTEGVTALQMDIKINGITESIMEQALAQAKDARFHILSVMQEGISEPRQDLSEFAPRISSFKINPEKIKDVIGKGGSTIRGLTEETGANIEISDEGIVTIATADGASAAEARRRIDLLTADVEVGKIYEGRVARIMDFGAFVTILPGKDGLLHVSQISQERVENVEDYLSVGETVRVKVLEVDRQGRVKLSRKVLLGAEA